MSLKMVIILIFFMLLSECFAEYRVYQYYVSSKVGTNRAYLVTSSLDPVSYVAYNGGSNSINTDLLRTWKCPGHTGGRSICASPYKRLLDNSRAVVTQQKTSF